MSKTVAEYRDEIVGHGKELCQVSVPQAFACFLEGKDFEDVMRNCISIGGDSDTIAAIAGGMAEAYYGVPMWIREQGIKYLNQASPMLAAICNDFYTDFEAMLVERR